ncbi:MAG: flagellar export protein FliJ [Kiritimatiellia bacterium]|jgi:flagellar export protein FliJ
MGNVLYTVHRIRKAEERRARVQLADDQRAFDGCAHAIQHIEDAVHASYDRCGEASNVVELVRHHSGALRMEMRRRRQERELHARRLKVAESNQRLQKVALETKLMELVADARAHAHEAEVTHRDQAVLNEQGLQSWWRRSA